MPEKRLRLVEVIVQPIVVEDDGEHLTSVGMQQVTIPASRFATLPDDLLAALLDEQERRCSKPGDSTQADTGNS